MIGETIACSLDIHSNCIGSLQFWPMINEEAINGGYVAFSSSENFNKVIITRTIEENTTLINFRIVPQRIADSWVIMDNIQITL